MVGIESAINAKQAKVTFNKGLSDDVDFTNFEVDGGLTITDAEVKGNIVTLTFNKDFTRNQEYTVTATGLKNADGEEAPETSGKFTWTVQEGITVNLEKSSVNQGEKFGLTVKDEDGKDVKNASVKVKSYNTNLLTVNSANAQSPKDVELTAQNAIAGDVKVTVETTLVDGTVLTNTFNVTVKEPVVNVAEKGFGFISSAFGTEPIVTGNDFQFANTVAFQKYANPKTELTVGEGDQYLYAFTETNGNPDTAYIDWSKAEKVTSSNAVAATAKLTNDGLVVTPKNAGNTKLTVEFTKESKIEKKTFDVKVNAKPVFTDINVDQTDVQLSDEARTANTEGVDTQSVKFYGIDQYNKLKNPDDGKVVISSSTDGVTLAAVTGKATTNAANNTVELDKTQLANLDKSDVFTITSQKDEIVNNAKVTIKYFEKATDADASITKTINVNVVDVDATEEATSLDVVLTHATIDANGKNTILNNQETEVGSMYLLDGNGNRLGTVATPNTVEYLTESDENIKEDSKKIVFEDGNNAQTYLRGSDTVNVRVTAQDNFTGAQSTDTLSKDVAVNYENTAVIPNKADVNTKSVAVKLADGETKINLDQILFGLADEDQLITDDGKSIGVLKNAKNSGYLYNKALVSVIGTDGEVMPLGFNLYGSDVTTVTTKNNNKWNNNFVNAKLKANNPFVKSGFDLDVDKSNIDASSNSVTVGGNVFTVPVKESLTLTVVLNGIYIEGADTTTDTAKAANNLLAEPVQINVSIEGADK